MTKELPIEINVTAEPGKDGYTPVKGTDYFTPEEQASFVSDIMSRIRVPQDGVDAQPMDYSKVESFIASEVAKIPKPEVVDNTVDTESIVAEVLKKIPEQPEIVVDYEALKKFCLEEIQKIEDNRDSRVRQLHSGGPTTRLNEISDVDADNATSGQVLSYNGSRWVPITISVPPTTSPGGSTTQVQFNDAGAFGGDAGFTYDKTTDSATLAGNLSVLDDPYAVGWNGSTNVPTKNAVYDKIETLVTGVSSVTATNSTLTISPTTGAVLAGLNLANANTWTGQQTFNTSTAIFGLAPTFSTMTAGSVLFAGTSGLLSQDNTNFFWNNSTKKLKLNNSLQFSQDASYNYILGDGGTNDNRSLWMSAGAGYESGGVAYGSGSVLFQGAAAGSLTTANGNGGAGGGMTFKPSDGGSSSFVGGGSNTGGGGGSVSVGSGYGGAASSSTNSNGGGSGGEIGFYANAGGSATGGVSATGGAGGRMIFNTGAGAVASGGSSSNNSGTGGALTYITGTGAQAIDVGVATNVGGAGGSISYTSGNGGDAGNSSTSNTTGDGGSVVFNSGRGGDVTGTGSAADFSGQGGNMQFFGGRGGASKFNGVAAGFGGLVTISGGTGGAGSVNGAIPNTGGGFTGTGGTGGGNTVAGANANVGGAGGSFQLKGGSGGAARSSTLSNTAGAGGFLNLLGGTGGISSSGTARQGGAGGYVNINGGTGSTLNGAGGSVYLVGGPGSGTGVVGNVYLGKDSSGNTRGTVIAVVPIRLKAYTVATLPAGVQGDTALATDLLAPAFLVAAVGGGAVVGPVFFNGAAWIAY